MSLTIDSQSYTGTYTGDLKMANHLAKVPFLFQMKRLIFCIRNLEKGKLNGSVTTTASDGSYTSCHYSDDKPYGRLLKYSANDQLTGYDFYYQMRTLSSLKEKSVNADYNVLLGTTFPDTPQK